MKVSQHQDDVFLYQGSTRQPGPLRSIIRSAAKWFPALFGALAVVLLVAGIWLCVYGEAYFSLTHRLPADVLIVEGWIGSEGIRAAAAEFERGGYKWIAATGGETQDGNGPANYAEMAARELAQLGVPRERIVTAPSGEVEHERTFKSAVAAWRAIQMRGIHPASINVLTLGPHARRSRLVYAKIYAPSAQVGVIAWAPSSYETEPWWRSSGRTKCFLKEIVGYPFEVLLNSGRVSNSPDWPKTGAGDPD